MKIFHTGDIHIGMKFNRYADVKEQLIEARFESLENMIKISNEKECDLFVIAGDLFNSLKVTNSEIRKTLNILNGFNGNAVLILPGNHDYDNGLNELWTTVKKAADDKILVINEKRPYSLRDYGLDAEVYPAPCNNKHSAENSLGWIKDIGVSDEFTYKIGVAHGAIEGLSADQQGQYYYMTFDELNRIPVDLWLIGHTHVSYPSERETVNSKIFNAGTPEADGLDFRDKAGAWFIVLDEKGNRAEKVDTGKYTFIDRTDEVKRREDLERLKNEILQKDPERKVVRLHLKGSLNREDYLNLKDYYREIEKSVLCLIPDDSELSEKVDEEKISTEFTKGSFPYEFLMKLKDDNEALQIAYDLIRGDN